jgi:hypothetical protein
VQDVQFVGQAVDHREATQWIVTWAMLSNNMASNSPEEVYEQRSRVEAFMRSHGLVHMGWLRVVSHGGPLTTSDIHKQKVCSRQGGSFRDNQPFMSRFLLLIRLGVAIHYDCQPVAIMLPALESG